MNGKVAVIITGGCINHRKGYMNACISRAVHLAKIADFKVDIYIINEYYREFGPLSLFRKIKHPKQITIEGYPIRMFWYAEYYAKRYFRRILNIYYSHNKKRLTDPEYLDKYVSCFQKYDLLCVHSSFGGHFAREVKTKFGIPYCITWHGSDTHTHPFENPDMFRMNVLSMQTAEYNFYVSCALQCKSQELTTNAKKMVLYNGADSSFYKYSAEKRMELRHKYGIKNDKIVAFVGNLYPIKNADLLPQIFRTIFYMYTGNVYFWIVGDGGLRNTMESELNNLQVPCKFWGNRPVDEMPDIMNCIDVLVLPSKNEGMPLVTIEAISCGANAVGSYVGGIPEVIGDDFCVPFGDEFAERFASKVVYVLNNPKEQALNPEINWDETAKKETKIYNEVLSRNDL